MRTRVMRAVRTVAMTAALVLVVGACGGDQVTGGPLLRAEVPAADALGGCASQQSASGEVTVYLVADGCAPGIDDGPLFVTSDAAWSLSEQFAVDGQGGWDALTEAFDAFDASGVASDLSLAYAAYRFERTIDRLTPVGWNASGDAWEFRMVTVGGEEEGVDVIPPYALRFEIAFDPGGDATGVTYLETCAVPGAEGIGAYPLDLPACP